VTDRPEIDRWIISRLYSLTKSVDAAYADFEPTRAGRLIQQFVTEELSNWYVRLCRRRFWKGEYNQDKLCAYQTLYQCLDTVAILTAPIAPFFADRLFKDLNAATKQHEVNSVHLANFPEVEETAIDLDLERRMDIAQRITSLVLGIRKQHKIRVRQPLQRLMIPIIDATFERQLHDVADIILSEVNVKEIDYLKDSEGVLVKEIKADFKQLGPRFGKDMKEIAALILGFGQEEISKLELDGNLSVKLKSGSEIKIEREDVQISTKDIPGWLVTSDGELTVALDITISETLREEGIAREFVNRIQNLRKDSGLEVTDRIALQIESRAEIEMAISNNLEYICAETLAGSLDLVANVSREKALEIELEGGVETYITLQKI